jgi:outer membrane murein-binding lipoprotein Lpp
MSDARAKLKAAIADYNTQSLKVERLSKAVDAARRAVDDAKAEIEGYADLDKEITRYRVAATKRGASPRNLPDDLKARVNGKKAADDELAQAESTLEELAAELKELRKTLQPLEAARVNAAGAVLIEEQGDDLAQEYIQAAERARQLFLQLGGLLLLEIEVDGKKYSMGGTQAMATAAVLGKNDSAILQQMFPEGANVFADMGGRWKTRMETLMKDPDAGITRPKPIAKTDYTQTNAGAYLDGHFGMRLPGQYTVKPEE